MYVCRIFVRLANLHVAPQYLVLGGIREFHSLIGYLCLKETRGYHKLKKEAVYRTVWRTRFGKQTTE
jgi:hypothetical protein